MRLDEEKLEALRRWAERLREEGGDEYAAAGRAILMLLAEIDELQEGLSELRLQAIPAASDSSPEVPGAPDPEEPAATLQNRLRRVLRRDSGASADAPAPDSATDSAQSWIESLRRQK